MINKKVTPLKLELLSSYELEITQAAPVISTHSGEASPSPFLDGCAAHAFYSTPALQERLDGLRHDVYAREKIQLLEAGRGVGKTAFLREFLRGCDPSWEVCHIQARIALGERHILARIAQAFFPSEQLDLHGLVERLVERGRNGPFTLLVVDDADNLSMFAVKILLDLKRALTMAGGRLGVVLAATPRLAALIADSSLRRYAAEWINVIVLPHLSEQETVDYLHHRIALAGAAIAFGEEQARLIHRCAGGAPKYINRAARDLLEGRRPRHYAERGRDDRPAPRRSLGGIAALAAVLALGAGAAGYALWSKPDAPVAPAAPPMTAGELAGLKDLMLKEGSAPEAAADAPRGAALPRAAAQSAPPAASQDPRPPPKPAVHELSPAKKNAALGGAPERAAPAATGGAAAAKVKTDAVRSVRPEAPPPAPVPQAAATAPPAAAAELAEPPAAPAGMAQPDSAAQAVRGNAWLLALDPARYTIQLVGFPRADMAGEFIRGHGLEEHAAAVQTVRGDRDWYLVLYKDFASIAEARSALAGLPDELRKNDPWVREVSAVSAVTVRR